MKLFFDQNISFRITKLVNDDFSGCKHVSECGLMDAEDSDIWQYAKRNKYAIVTFDSDFYEISLIKGHPPKIILIRTGNLTTSELAALLNKKFESINNFLINTEFEHVSCVELENNH